MTRIYYRGAYAAIICYDLTDDQSFEKARFWGNELKQNEEVPRLNYHCTALYDTDNKQQSQNILVSFVWVSITCMS